jgi:hypothetical protein
MAEPDYSKFRSMFGIPGKSGDFSGRPLKREPSKKLSAYEVGQAVRSPLDATRTGITNVLEATLPTLSSFTSGVMGEPPATTNAVTVAKNAAGTGGAANGQWDVLPPPSTTAASRGAVTNVGNGISRRGNTYSNQGVEGLDSIDNARGPSNALPSVAGFLAGVKPGDLSLLNPQSAWDSRLAEGGGGGGGFYVSPGSARTGSTRPNADGTMPGGGFEGLVPGRRNVGGGGLIPPEISEALTGLAESSKAGGNSIVDMYRRRQARKSHALTLSGAAAVMNAGSNARMADASVMRAENEFPLAEMNIGARRQDVRETNAMHKYGYDTAAKSAANRDEFDLARFLPQMKRDEWGNRLYEQGKRSEAQELWTAGRFPPTPRNPAVQQIPGGVFSIGADGKPSYYSQQDLENMRPGMPSAADIKKHADDVRAGR